MSGNITGYRRSIDGERRGGLLSLLPSCFVPDTIGSTIAHCLHQYSIKHASLLIQSCMAFVSHRAGLLVAASVRGHVAPCKEEPTARDPQQDHSKGARNHKQSFSHDACNFIQVISYVHDVFVACGLHVRVFCKNLCPKNLRDIQHRWMCTEPSRLPALAFDHHG